MANQNFISRADVSTFLTDKINVKSRKYYLKNQKELENLFESNAPIIVNSKKEKS